MSKANVHFVLAAVLFATAASPTLKAAPQQAEAPASGPQRVHVGANVIAANIVEQKKPVYPPEAKAARIEGTVKLQAVIGADGHVASLNVISGPPELVASAIDAVHDWVYKPTMLNGTPVEVITTVDVNYTLAQ